MEYTWDEITKYSEKEEWLQKAIFTKNPMITISLAYSIQLSLSRLDRLLVSERCYESLWMCLN